MVRARLESPLAVAAYAAGQPDVGAAALASGLGLGCPDASGGPDGFWRFLLASQPGGSPPQCLIVDWVRFSVEVTEVYQPDLPPYQRKMRWPNSKQGQ